MNTKGTGDRPKKEAYNSKTIRVCVEVLEITHEIDLKVKQLIKEGRTNELERLKEKILGELDAPEN